MKHYYLGMAVNYANGEWLRHLCTFGRRKDHDALMRYLSRKYKGEAILCKNGRSALALALKAYFEPGDEILINGFTCYAVLEAIKAAGLKPRFVDIDKNTLNFNNESLAASLNPGGQTAEESRVKGLIIQNTLGNPVNIKSIETFAKENNLMIIEDLAHCTGVRYPDKREVGTVGVACALSFGKDKSIDTVSGGAVVLRKPPLHPVKAPSQGPRPSDHLRARFYPVFGAISRGLSYIGVGGVLMRGLVKIHWVERSADNRLDLNRRLSKFESKLALKQFMEIRKNGEPPLRDFCFVQNRDEVLRKLQKKGFYFGGLWYEKPISPERYYAKANFPENECPNAVYASEHIINIPNYYTRRDLAAARKIIKDYLEDSKTMMNNKSDYPDNTVWKEVIEKHKEANFLQSPSYGEMNKMLGDKAIIETFNKNGYALMIVRNAKRGRYLEIPCGPLIDWSNKKLVKKVFERIKEIAKAEKCVFVRIRPQLQCTKENLKLLAELGLSKSPMHLAAEHTTIIDLTKDEDQLLANMRRQTRYEVRRADKMGIVVECDNSEKLFKEFHRVQAKTAKRQGFVPPSLDTLIAEREAFGDNAKIYVAKTAEGEKIAYGLVIKDGVEGDYYEAASTDLNRKLPGAYALLWKAMRDLKAEGYERFNLWGIAPANQPQHRYAKVTTFKMGFGGETVEFVPAHDLVISRVGYLKNLIVEKVRKKRRHL